MRAASPFTASAKVVLFAEGVRRVCGVCCVAGGRCPKTHLALEEHDTCGTTLAVKLS